MRYLSLAGILLLGSSPLSAQFLDFASTPDGSALYFSSTLIETGKQQSARSKIFRIVDSGLQLVVEEAQRPSNDPDIFRTQLGVRAPILNTLGHLVGWSTVDACFPYENINCVFRFGARMQYSYGGRIVGTQISGSPLPPIYSPSRLYFASRRYSQGPVQVSVGSTDPNFKPTQVPNGGGGLSPVEIDGGLGPNVAINDEGTLFVLNESKLTILPLGATVPLPPIDLFQVNWAVLSPATQAILVGRGSTIESISAAGIRRTYADLNGLNCPVAQVASSGTLVLGCNSLKPFWSLNLSGKLAPIDLNTSVPLTWTLASDGDVIWLLDPGNRFLKYTISAGELRQMLGTTPILAPSQSDYFALGAPYPIMGSGFTPNTLPIVSSLGRPLPVTYATPLLAHVIAPIDDLCLDLQIEPSLTAPFITPPAAQRRCTRARADEPLYLYYSSGRSEWGIDRPLIVNSDFSSLIGAANPPSAGSIVHLFLSSLGPTSPTVPAGEPTPPVGSFPLVAPPSCKLGPAAAEVLYAGLAPGGIGVYQLSIRLPDPLPSAPALFGCTTFDPPRINYAVRFPLP